MGCNTPSKTDSVNALKNELARATETVENTIDNWDENVSPWLFKGTSGVAVFPDVVKKSFLLGRSKGRGVLSVQQKDGSWSLPIFITLHGRSAGLQAGARGSNLILAFKNSDPIGLIKDQSSVKSGNISVMAGPRGHDVGAGTDSHMSAGVYSYAYGKGLFVGVSLGSMKIEIDWGANMAFYGISVGDIDSILSGRVKKSAGSTEQFRHALETASVWDLADKRGVFPRSY